MKRDDRFEAIVARLSMTSEHVRGVADVLALYIDTCKEHGLHGPAKALRTAVDHLEVVARLNDRAILDTRKTQEVKAP